MHKPGIFVPLPKFALEQSNITATQLLNILWIVDTEARLVIGQSVASQSAKFLTIHHIDEVTIELQHPGRWLPDDKAP